LKKFWRFKKISKKISGNFHAGIFHGKKVKIKTAILTSFSKSETILWFLYFQTPAGKNSLQKKN